MTITSEVLKQAGFECIGRDKLCEKWELRTKWQTLNLWHNYTKHNAPYRMSGLQHPDDRMTVFDTQEIYNFAMLSGADLEMRQMLKVFDESNRKEVNHGRMVLLMKLLEEICDATTEMVKDDANETVYPEMRYVPTFDFDADDLQTIRILADEELQDYSILTNPIDENCD